MKKCFDILVNGIAVGSIAKDCCESSDFDIDKPWVIKESTGGLIGEKFRFKTLLDASRESKKIFSNSVLLVAE